MLSFWNEDGFSFDRRRVYSPGLNIRPLGNVQDFFTHRSHVTLARDSHLEFWSILNVNFRRGSTLDLSRSHSSDRANFVVNRDCRFSADETSSSESENFPTEHTREPWGDRS